VRICKYEARNQINESTKDISKSLLVKNLEKSITAKDFYKLFEEFGEISSSKLEVDENGVSKGYGYVHFSDAKSAEKAKEKLVFFNIVIVIRTEKK
jgi:RNA recognition motif-containing protein